MWGKCDLVYLQDFLNIKKKILISKNKRLKTHEGIISKKESKDHF